MADSQPAPKIHSSDSVNSADNTVPAISKADSDDLHVSIQFTNSLIRILQDLPATFEEHLAKVSSQSRNAYRVGTRGPKAEQVIIVDEDFEDDLRDALQKLKSERRAEWNGLVEEFKEGEGKIEKLSAGR